MLTEPGVYEHYKGGLYRVLFEAHESSNGRERERLIVYVSLKHGSVNVRKRDEFLEMLTVDGKPRARFQYMMPQPE